MKTPQSVKNFSGGYDLRVEKDSGNEVLIMTGSTEHSREFWFAIQLLAIDALAGMDLAEGK